VTNKLKMIEEVEKAKSESDDLMLNKIAYYENRINELENKIADLQECLKVRDYSPPFNSEG
tara:strand:- start:827 stop:1009 length:183 start_codon:yes stop_codon:yes gene_type:complete